MKHSIKIVLALFLALGLLTACGTTDNKAEEKSSEKSSESVSEPVTVEDALGDDITLEKAPEKIVTLIPSNTEILFELGLGENVVGVTDFDNYPKEAADIEKIGGMEFNVEKIVGMKPDLVLAHESTAVSAKAGLDQIRDSGIPVYVVRDASSFDKVYTTIENIGKLVGENEKAEKVVSDMKDGIESIKEKTASVKDKKSVYVEVSGEPEIYSTGKNTFVDEMLATINADNVMGDQEGWINVSEEDVLAKNPDVIITTYGEQAVQQVLDRSAWKDVQAIKDEEVHDVNTDLVTRSGPRIVEGVEEIAKAVYPELFKE
ncbi:ABC transporter substrate-binding protein [Rossellomorea marisflavi]|uniref:Iron ABC transporter substrate-binding protein n=1 Tax=Rossellomorea marisflavi TaxID=189381 RepID=A0A0J5VI07_9BACI|nr:ABC transporter substrate-binding protein [Rossellomorea marisflavi]VXB77259.1 putative lipoprotein binding vitamin B12 [Bacillus sp. 349Y]KMK97367.1 iron ABC transporter substrate-binding protein [Rossellomorea marisflavi]KML35271.1 iron ABC transporter substrate-binding protein [Rossellomorea marisflavi]KZE45401.1 iron ABC transporter substrate-binding protein [Rossellomorea marisflavi]MCM2604109.1 ABC transporter substrate-binding protein [Rossellomorea marisflavi]